MARSERGESWRLADELLELTKADTAFADLYLVRARELLGAELSEAQYAGLSDLDGDAANLANRIASAMEAGAWGEVGELSGKLSDLKRTLSDRAPIRAVAARVYGFEEILVDPFSPGISGLAGVPERELPALRDAAAKRLERLRAADPGWGDLYGARRDALAGLQLAETGAAAAAEAKPSVGTLRARAQKALVDGDLGQLQQLSAQILEAERSVGTGAQAGAAPDAVQRAPDLAQAFARDVCDRAGKLGLAAHRIESTTEQQRARFRPAWRPAPVGEASGNALRLSVAIPGDAPEALRDTLELLMNRAFVTSAGTRYMPWFGAEDVLVEDFDDPSPDANPTSPLLQALGLPTRKGLARKTIEKAFRERGAAVVKELGLDPGAYRVVCLPVDVYTRLGLKRGWGKQETWTHFDGYMASKDRKFLALAGGDVRFGGLHDLVGVGADYDSDRLFARFAVVQRRRFETWGGRS